jgi:ankyrin repeat protein
VEGLEGLFVRIARLFVCSLIIACVGVTVAGCSGGTEIGAVGSGPDANSANASPAEKMIQAAGKGDLKAMESLLGSDPEFVNTVGMMGMTPLHVAAAGGQNEAVTFLLENGADPFVEDDNGSTPDNTANVEGHPDTAKIIQDWIAANGG